ncbi:MAG: response regulator, partial [Deltaproteobacteria bacterium]|nr:response regulator [Deltaproteobacteria bacterium]
VEAGKLKLEYTPVSPQRLLNEMRTIFRQKIDDKGLEFFVDIAPKLPEAMLIDATRLRQILINLIENAIKFTDTGHIRLSVNYRSIDDSSPSDLDLIFSVEDTGIGIPKDQCKSIFDSFSQAKGQNFAKFGGTGLGLAITMRLIDMMGGRVSVSSEMGKGSTFEIVIKDVEVTSSDLLEDLNDKEIDFEAVTFEPCTILVADDVDYDRALILSFFDRYDITLIEAESGAEAIEKAEEHHPDLILLDMRMPVMNGYEAANILKKEPDLKDIPIIAITASAMKEEEAKIRKLCDSYLQKPVSKPDLIFELMKYLPYTLEEKMPVTRQTTEKPIIPPPAEEMHALYELAIGGSMRKILKKANSLEQLDNQYQPFAVKLRELAQGYQDEELIILIEKYMEKSNERDM